jgi:hypothetical protein
MKIKTSSTMMLVLREARSRNFKTQSNFAREFAQEVGALASMGFITTTDAPGVYGNTWRITGTGLEILQKGGLL